MKYIRSASRVRFECRECGARVNSASYRAACPACGGALRAGSVVNRRGER